MLLSLDEAPLTLSLEDAINEPGISAQSQLGNGIQGILCRSLQWHSTYVLAVLSPTGLEGGWCMFPVPV